MREPLIDIGLNLTHKQFASDREEVVERALAAGVARMMVTGLTQGEPVFLHERSAHDDFVRILSNFAGKLVGEAERAVARHTSATAERVFGLGAESSDVP